LLTLSVSLASTESKNGILFANPIPEEFSLPKAEIDIAINQAVQEAAQQGFHGHSNTPFILSRIKELTRGNSIQANRALIESNVAMATKVAVELSKFRQEFSHIIHISEHEALQERFPKAAARDPQNESKITPPNVVSIPSSF
jgi:pseudouridylate synthase / pseudouridine kinase